MANEIVQRGMIARLLAYAQKQQDGQQSSPSGARMGPYGESFTIPMLSNKCALAEEGSYVTNGMAAAASAVTYGVTTPYTTLATSFPLFILQNLAAAGGVNVVPDFIRWILTTAPTAAISAYLTLILDATRIPTANFTQVANQTNASGAATASSASGLIVAASGANMTIAAATAAARTLVRAYQMRVQIPVALDENEIRFGSVDGLAGGYATVASGSAGPGRIVAQAPPIVIPPGWSLYGYLWFPSSSGYAAFNYLEEGHYER